MAARHAAKQIPCEPHWASCYSMLHRVSRSFAPVIQQLGTELRNAVCIFYLVLRALDTVEDDTSIPTDVKVPILIAFHRHIYDRDWHFSCGTKDYKVLMDQFHDVSTAFLELEKGYQEAIEDTTKKMGAGMAKFICKELETIDDYDEYSHYAAGLDCFFRKQTSFVIIWRDINEIPKSRMFWPREIWSKYVNKLEDLKNEENSVKAVQCLNEMVTNSLIHVNGCLEFMSELREPDILPFFAIPQVMAIGTLALCYNNINVFKGVVKMRRGLTAQIIHRTKTMADVYGAFFDFSCMLKSKVDKNDPNAAKTLSSLEAIQKTCRESGALNKRKSYIIRNELKYNSVLTVLLLIILSIIFASLSANRSSYWGWSIS
ncbi:FARNESYL-DIPHOSPHATE FARNESYLTRANSFERASE [Salix viminalis]|uniref:FARNESYL-DIPHOSPHATE FARNESYLTRANSFERASE n=1 Tax=Salix viminalis TaxID=40686 RepID=A0A9Q0SC62_SALVM|nr:FARNESYL-DIPHOSPHATE FARNESYLTRANSFERASE [Salix viminalis]